MLLSSREDITSLFFAFITLCITVQLKHTCSKQNLYRFLSLCWNQPADIAFFQWWRESVSPFDRSDVTDDPSAAGESRALDDTGFYLTFKRLHSSSMQQSVGVETTQEPLITSWVCSQPYFASQKKTKDKHNKSPLLYWNSWAVYRWGKPSDAKTESRIKVCSRAS